ncbi:MAG: heme NO-binding domain-containing protein [Rhodocyclaceae bacterium]|nr:heme NO-binding domain-containing protein [Rhodocyclaceae bacterium]
MKGIVFTEFIEMVEQKFSPETADRILDECDLASGGAYTAVGTYDHREIVSMVLKLSEISGLPVPALIKAFGYHLFERFVLLYPSFFAGISSAMDFLSRIEDIIHAEVKKLYPDAELPRFDVARENEDTLVLTYHSERHLGDLAEGLIESCIHHFGAPLTLLREDLEQPGQPIRFTIRR